MMIPGPWLNKIQQEKRDKEKEVPSGPLVCPACGSKATYIGLKSVECTNKDCRWFISPKSDSSSESSETSESDLKPETD